MYYYFWITLVVVLPFEPRIYYKSSHGTRRDRYTHVRVPGDRHDYTGIDFTRRNTKSYTWNLSNILRFSFRSKHPTSQLVVSCVLFEYFFVCECVALDFIHMLFRTYFFDYLHDLSKWSRKMNVPRIDI